MILSHRRSARPLPSAYGIFRRTVNIMVAAFLVLWLAVSPSKADTLRLLGLGDSLMAGYGLAKKDSFPTQLESALKDRGHDVTLLNAGVSGDTTAGGRSRLAWSLADKPNAVIVELGGNDGLRGLPPKETEKNLRAILQELKQQGLPVLLTGMLAPPNMGRAYGAKFNAVFGKLADEFEVVFYPFFLEGVAGEPTLNQPDGIHPNEEGVKVIVARILPSVEALLAKVR